MPWPPSGRSGAVVPVAWALAVSAIGLLGCRSSDRAGGRPRNLLLLTLDTTRADHLRCYGNASAQTPALDALAARGVRVRDAIAGVPLTRPSHATILTGLLPQHHGVWSNGPFRLEAAGLAARFRAAGFHTGAVVASFVLARSFGFAEGFESFDDRVREGPDADPERPAGEVSEVARSWLGTRLHPPFFLWLHFYDPHFPYQPPEPYRTRFSRDPYAGEIAYVDHAVSEVLGALERQGWLEETLVVAVGDHGEGLGEHQEPTHGYFLYDATLRVPLVLAGPGVPRGRVAPGPVGLVDLAPTLAEAFHLASGGSSPDGRSFWNELTRGEVPARPALIENRTIHDQFGWAALAGIRTAGWKLVDAPEPELFDLVRDPGETRNLAGSEGAELAALRRQLAGLRPSDRAAAPAHPLTPEQEERLAALGYVGGGAGAAGGGGGDPKRFAPTVALLEELIRQRAHADSPEVGRLIDGILARDPGNLFALRVQGERLLRQRRFAEAAAVLRPLLSGTAHQETVAALAEACERLGDLDEAARLYQRATTPPWVYWPALEAMARFAGRHPARLAPAAVRARLERLDPATLEEAVPLARAFALLSAWDAAERWYRRGLELDPASTEALVGLAQMLGKTRREREGIEVLGRVARPTAESLFVAGTLRAATGQGARACADFEAALPLAREASANLLLVLGRRLAACGALEPAAASLDAALRSEPGLLDALAERAAVAERLGRPAEAAALYRRLLLQAPPDRPELRRAARQRLAALRR